jgi:hypothetical protein
MLAAVMALKAYSVCSISTLFRGRAQDRERLVEGQTNQLGKVFPGLKRL